ncbi:receptor protein [Salix suchowensis]|nr:receptor protein [Salix suchowensis]
MMMKKMWVWMWLTLLPCDCCHGCFEEERSGLLEIKALINPNSLFGHLGGWTASKELDIANCCEWYGIKCDNTTRRVIQLSLAGARDFRLGDWVLNASLFLPFKELQGLNLSRNRLVGFEVLSSELRKLNVLDLSGNCFSNNLVSLRNLESLSLKMNEYNDSIFSTLTGFSSLKSLDLSYNQLTGSAGFNGWCEFKNLEQLDISWNNLRGSLPDCFRNFSSLKLLDVSGNRFTGNIASGPLSSLISLEFLSLSNNHFEVPLSFNSFMNHSKLKFFICDHSTLILGDKASFQNFIPKLQVKFFSLSILCTVFYLTIKNTVFNRILDLSHNNFSGMFPSWLLKNNTRLEQLNLRENSFAGPLILQNQPNPYMTVVDISNNKISGQVPRNICSVFPDLSILRMAMNGLTGCLPSCFGNMSSLEHMDLSDNQLSIVKLEQLKSSWIVNLSNNNLVGQIPLSIFNSSAFLYLYLDGNNFTGQISGFPPPSWIHLSALDISSNQLSGMLPAWMGNFSYLQAMDLSRNHFQGPIPRDFCDLGSVKYLDMSENNLLGSVPSCFSPSTIKHVHLSKNQLSGPLTEAFYNSSSLVTLDLNYNNFMGPVSNWIGNLSVLSVLLLKANNFSGEFPTQLCLLERLTILDVSQNKLSGFLPSCLANYSLKQNLDKAAAFHERTFKIKSISKMYSETNLLLGRIDNQGRSFRVVNIEEAIEFTTKRRSDDYKGTVLNFMTGFDLSINRFSGEIPLEMGKLSELHALNLSHNNLTGSIPATFSNLKQIESLDLSHNNLDGVIPPQLVVLNNLAVFSVAHNFSGVHY